MAFTTFDASQLGQNPIGPANLLDNGGFEIWQRGNTFTNPISGAYSADRWQVGKSGGITVNVTKDTSIFDSDTASANVNITVASGSQMYLIQYVENYTFFKGKTVSYSCRVKTSTAGKVRLAMSDGVAQTFSAYHSGSGNFETLSMTFAVSNSASVLSCYVGIVADTVVTTQYWADGAMLVLGSQAASFVTMHPEVDLARCQRYYQQFDANNSGLIMVMMNYGTNICQGVTALPVQMRTNPTTTFSSASDFEVVIPNGGGGLAGISCTALTVSGGKKAVNIQANVSSGLTSGNANLFIITGINAVIGMSSDL